MASMWERLAVPLSRCEAVLSAQPEQRREFEVWAVKLLDDLLRAERLGPRVLEARLPALRREVHALDGALNRHGEVSARSQLMRLARREWLLAVLELVDELKQGATPGLPDEPRAE